MRFRKNILDITSNTMINNGGAKYCIDLSFEEIKLPPFEDILILGKNSPHGKIGIYNSFQFLLPDGFEILEINDDKVEAIFISKRLLTKISKEKIFKILKEKVFKFISDGDLLKVKLDVIISYSNIELVS